MRITAYLPIIYIFFLSCRNAPINNVLPPGKVSSLSIPTDSNTFYFPMKRIQRDRDNREQNLDSFTNRWYSQILFALKEPTMSDYIGPKEIYRFTYIPSIFNYPVSVTLGKESDKFWMTVKAITYKEGYQPGAITIDTTITIPQEDWSNFQQLLKKTRFWTLQAEMNDNGDDGWECILEGTKNGKYHFATRWSPDEARYPEYRECCDYLRNLANKSVNFHGQF